MRKNVYMILEGEFPPDLRVMNEAETLQRHDYNVFIFSLDFSALGSHHVLDNGITVIRQKVDKAFYNKFRITTRWLPFVNSFWKSFVQSYDETPDVIHVHDLALAKVGWQLAKKFNAKFVVDFHENYPAALDVWSYSSSGIGRILMPRWQWHRFEWKAVNKADRIIVVIDEAMERFKRVDNFSDKFVVVSNTINLQELSALQFSTQNDTRFKNRFNVVYTGGFGPHRGIDVLLRAVPIIKNRIPNILIWIVGDGSDRVAMEKLMSELAVSDSVVFTGYQPINKMSEIIFHSDVAIVPHIKSEHTETTIPHKIFHYMYWRKPIIASDCTPIKRIIEESRSGLVYSSTDEYDLAEKVVLIKNDQTPFGRNGREAVEKKYNWQMESEKLLKLYSGLDGPRKV